MTAIPTGRRKGMNKGAVVARFFFHSPVPIVIVKLPSFPSIKIFVLLLAPTTVRNFPPFLAWIRYSLVVPSVFFE